VRPAEQGLLAVWETVERGMGPVIIPTPKARQARATISLTSYRPGLLLSLLVPSDKTTKTDDSERRGDLLITRKGD
jgi:hypothetical protein